MFVLQDGHTSHITEKVSLFNKIICYSYQHKIKLLTLLFKYTLHLELLHIPAHGTEPSGNIIRMPHPFNIIINSKTRIGKNTTIYHGVTIGSKRFGARQGTPIIGDNVIIFPNSLIFGGITIGNNSIIGAGSVVTDNIPNDAIVAGNPAKTIKLMNEIK